MGMAMGIALAPAAVNAQDPVVKPPAPLVEQTQPQGPRARLAYQAGSDSYRRGEFELAAAYFQQAQAGQDDLTAAEKKELAGMLQLNATAIKARREGANQLSQAELAMRQGRTQDALAYLKAVTPNQQFLSAEDQQRMKTLSDRLMPGRSAVDPGANPSAQAQARTKLKQARLMLSRGEYEAALTMAQEADKLNAAYLPTEDTPKKVMEDVARARTPSDAKSMLVAARAALARKDFDEAERLAHAADKATSVLKSMTHVWSDSPSKVLKDVEKERAKAMAVQNTLKVDRNVAITSEKPKPAADNTETARQMLKDARLALQAGNVAQAKELTENARKLHPELNWWEDTPEKLTDAIRQSEGVAQVQGRQPAKDSSKPEPAGGDPRVMLKQARQFYEAGKLDDAQSLAMRANSKPTHWGLFEDSPEKLMQDIRQALEKAHQEESVRLLAEARKLYENGNYAEAEQKAHRAQNLHGPYRLWELGDRPQKLIADIETARNKQRKTAMPPPPGELASREQPKLVPPVTTQPTAPAPNWPLPNSTAGQVANSAQSPLVTPPPAPSFDSGKKAQAKLLLTQARQLQGEGRLLEAREKAIEAQRVGAAFSAEEDRPEAVLLAISALCQKRIDNLVQQASEALSGAEADPSRYQRAERDLTQAKQLAVGCKLDTQAIDSKLTWLQQVRGKSSSLEAGTGRAMISPVQHIEAPAALVAPPSQTPPAVAAEGSQQGRNLLNQARLELRAGQTLSARRLAEAAYAPEFGVQTEAAAVLRSIDAEERNQQILSANRDFDAGMSAYYQRDYSRAGSILRSIDPRVLSLDKQDRLKEIMGAAEMQPTSPVVQAGTTPPPSGAGVARVSDQAGPSTQPPTVEADFASQVRALQEVKFQKLRDECLKVMAEATNRFKVGETDKALDMLSDFKARLLDAGLDSQQTAMLTRQVDARLDRFKALKDREDLERLQITQRDAKEKAFKHQLLAEEDKKKQISELMKQYNVLYKEGKYKEAEMVASRAHDLDPDDPVSGGAIYQAQLHAASTRAKDAKTSREKIFEGAMNDTENQGQLLTLDDPVGFNPDVSRNNRKRGELLNTLGTIKNERERKIYRQLDSPCPSMDFKDTPLRQILDDIAGWTGMNIVNDEPALGEAGISLDRPITMKLEGVALKSALNLLLHQAHLTYVVKDEVLNITTEEHSRGKMKLVVHPVMDLIIPVNNSPGGDSTGVLAGLGQGTVDTSNLKLGSQQPYLGLNSLGGAKDVSQMATGGLPQVASNGPTVTKSNPRGTLEDVLIKLIQTSVAPTSWDSMGGQGHIEFFPLGGALAINQTPDIQEQVKELLDALRRLQDQEVAVEIRFITLNESFYERIGVDFAINIRNNNSKYEPQLVSQQFKPFGFINNFSPKSFISGLTPAGTSYNFTQDLGIPIKASSFQMAVPPFGQSPNIPGADGGISLGLAFLSDIEVFMFMEASQGDQRSNVMQAPKLSLFNGQVSTITIADTQFFVLGMTVVQVGGQVVFVPQNTPIPTGGVTLTMNAVISADRRFVRMSLTPVLTNLSTADVPLFPITTFITPIFEGGAVGQPIPFTQFLQQPSLQGITVNTSVNVPDGGTVLLGGLKRLSEGRNEFGPPILSKIPYLNRLFKNVGYGRETESLMMMVTPRIIILEEEESRQVPGISSGPPGALP
jgi:type II secretory pathway component GspD/PulD (secretin)